MSAELQLFAFVLVLTRVSAFIGFLPLFGRRQMPQLVKAGLALALTVFWYGCLDLSQLNLPEPDPVIAVLYLVQEGTIGFLLALLIGFMLIPARIAGAYIGQEIGLSLASMSSASTTDSSTLVTTIFETLAVLLFFGLDMHHFMIAFFHFSITDLFGGISLTDLPSEMLVQIAGSLTEHGVLLVGPVGVCLMILTVGLALLNKAAPTLNLFSVGMTLRSGLGIGLLIIFFPLIIHAMDAYFQVHQSRLESFLVYFQ